jgi:Kef-type K+ transport system membrane component KefB
MRLLLQIGVTIAVARAFSVLLRRAGQPAVIGEIVGGIALGPTLFGWLFPTAFHALFRPDSMQPFLWLAEAGVAVFMFVVGLDLELPSLRTRRRTAIIISQASIAVPLLLGTLLAVCLFDHFAPAGTRFPPFALFIGVAMSITAFPVLARILAERGMSGTPVGTLALTCAAVDDLTAWCLLALVTAIARAEQWTAAAKETALIALFTVLMLAVVRPLLRRVSTPAVFLLVGIASAAVTHQIGMHVIFGAFLAGACVPREAAAHARLRSALGSVQYLLLPLFFAATGIRSEITLLFDAGTLLMCIGVIVVATVGKLAGSSIAARLTGSSWHDALVLGTLMNSRGLMELVVLNVGYDLGIISPQLFAAMVVMALVTTIATGPLLSQIETLRWLGNGDERSLQPR